MTRRTPPAVSLSEAMTDPAFFRRHFGGPSWAQWVVLARGLDARAPESDADVAAFWRGTERPWPTERPREVWVISPRRTGKTSFGAFYGVCTACFRDHRAHLAPGERAVVMILACDRAQAKVTFDRVRGFLEHPLLHPLVEAERAESIDLRGCVSIEVHTASYRSVRGRTLVAAILDEVAFWRDETSANPDAEVVAALRPALATTNGMLLGLSTPYARRGVLWTQFNRHFGKDGSPVLVWKADARTMNPQIPEELIQAALAEDEAAARSEWLGEFRSDLESFVDRERVEACVIPNRGEAAALQGVSYRGFADASGGRVGLLRARDRAPRERRGCDRRGARATSTVQSRRRGARVHEPVSILRRLAARGRQIRRQLGHRAVSFAWLVL